MSNNANPSAAPARPREQHADRLERCRSGRSIFRLDLDTDALQERRRQVATDADDDGIVPDLGEGAVLLDPDVAVEDVCDVGPLPHRESRVRHRLVHTLAVLFLRPRERQKLFLRSLAEPDVPDRGEPHRLRHHDLAPWVLIHGSPEGLLLERDVTKSVLHGGERAREARRPPAHDDYVRVWSPPDAVELSDRVDRLLALRDRIRDEPHPAELAGDEDPRDAGLKGWAE